MKYLTHKLFFFTGIAFFCISCNKEDPYEYKDFSRGIPLTLSYKYYEIEGFKLYVGSPSGGKELSTNRIYPKMYWQVFFTEKDCLFQSLSFHFLLKQKVIDLSTNDTLLYRFTKNRLEWRSAGTNNWIHSGFYGDLKKLYSKQSFYSFRICNESNIVLRESNTSIDYQNLDSILQRTGLRSLKQMINSSDTIIWCNVNYVLK